MNFVDTIRNQPTVLEDQVVAAFITSRKFHIDNSERILSLPQVGLVRSKFGNFTNSIVFEGICEIRSRVRDNVVPKQLLTDYMESAFTKGLLFADERDKTTAHISNLYDKAESATVEFVDGDLFDAWFNAGLGEDIANLVNSSDNVYDVDDLAEKINRIQLLKTKKENKTVSVMSSIRRDEDIGDVIPSGIGKLDRNLGGGFRCGESTIFAATTGGGKTVMACQMAGQFAGMGRKTIFVTTEQQPNELTPRFLSNMCSIPIEEFHRDFQGAGTTIIPNHVLQNTEYSVKVANSLNVLHSHVKYIDWSGGDGMSIEKDLDPAIDAIVNDPEDPFEAEVLIFDWLGGALKKDANKDLRIMYLDGAEYLHNIAKQRKISVLFFAQLNKVKARNRARCDSSMLAECTSLPDKASNAIYVSSVMSDEGENSYSMTQKMNVDKARKGPMGTLDVIRDFKHQRFVSPSSINSL